MKNNEALNPFITFEAEKSKVKTIVTKNGKEDNRKLKFGNNASFHTKLGLPTYENFISKELLNAIK